MLTDGPGVTGALAPLRLLTWNVWHLLGDPLAVQRILGAAAADLVCLQEAPRLPWSRLQLGALARASGLIIVAGGWSGAGTAMLASAKVEVRDPVAFGFPWLSWRSTRRGAVLATVRLTGANDLTRVDGPAGLGGWPAESAIRVACVHLGLDAAERRSHVAVLVDKLSQTGRRMPLPVVVAGDFNEPPGGSSWQAFSAVATDPAPRAGPTFSVARPRVRIDAVLTGPDVETLEYGEWQPDSRDTALASDHLPVLTLLRPARTQAED